jgi:hypothetical protein
VKKRLALAALAVLLGNTSCAISRPTITQLVLSDPPLFLVAQPLRYMTTDRRHQITVPVGFVSDLASIPRPLWWWQSPLDATMAPAIIHDYLYWEQSCSKDEADAVMWLAMRDLAVSGINAVYVGIRTPLAETAWRDNTQARGRGETRFLTAGYAARLMRSDADPRATWVSIQAAAVKEAGMYTPSLPNPEVKAACQAAHRHFRDQYK